MLVAGFAETELGRSFDSLSLREITRSAGIAPTTFYRHFRDMDEYGLAMTEAAEELVKEDAKVLKQTLFQEGESVRAAVASVITAMQHHPAEYRLLLNLRLGPNAILRAGSRRVLNKLGESLAEGLLELAQQRRRPVAQPELAAESIISLVWGRASDIMAPLHKSPDAITEELFAAVRLVLIGAEQPTRIGVAHRDIA